VLKKIGFKQGRASACNFAHAERDIKLTVHGDDFLIVADAGQLKWIDNKLKENYETKTEILGPEAGMVQEVGILNRKLRWMEDKIEYEADSRHADVIIEECEVMSMKPSKVPGVSEPEIDKEENDQEESQKTKFRGVAARINYLAMDRPDLQYAAKNLCRRMANPRISDWEKARKIAKYIKGRPRLIMQFPFEEFESKVNGYADSDWAGEKPSMKSTSGGLIMWGNSTLKSWSSTQTTIAMSSGEAELYAMSKCAQQVLSMMSIAGDFDIKMDGKVHSDSTAAIGIAYRRGLGGKTRHVRVQYLWIQEAIANRDIGIDKVGTQDNPADVLTKFVGAELMNKHCNKMGVRFPEARSLYRKAMNTLEDLEEATQRVRSFSKHVGIAKVLSKELAGLLSD
jgi:hypothetical protein